MSSYPPSAATDPSLPHDSLVPHILGICSAMLIVVTLVVAARFWIRLRLVQGRFGADDWCILVAWVLAVAFDLDPINREYLQQGFSCHRRQGTPAFQAHTALAPQIHIRCECLLPLQETKYGLGRHIYDLEPDVQFYKSLKVCCMNTIQSDHDMF